MSALNRIEKREISLKRKYLARQNQYFTERAVEIPKENWPYDNIGNRVAVFRSKTHLIQVFNEKGGIVRLSICRAEIGRDGQWLEGITWDELHRIKAECGFGDRDAVEVYPAAGDLVNVANIRHLWVLPYKLEFAWRA